MMYSCWKGCWSGLSERKALVPLHESACYHSAIILTYFLTNCHRVKSNNQPFPPDLTPVVIFPSVKWKITLKGRWFQLLEETKKVTTKLSAFPGDALVTSVQVLEDVKNVLQSRKITLMENRTICYVFHLYYLIGQVPELQCITWNIF
jgi:hypothetical protein